ncbi:MAG: xanthine dehydrogenase small subunit [Pseudomonadales bacterium]
MIQFLLNRQHICERELDPNITVLEYLRTRAIKKGTKEGCASGDCGACTAVLVSLEGEQLRYTSINTCLTFIASLHGMQLITVEDLAYRGALHKAQQAMVDHHGSQCGYCTPGFVMSMFALSKNTKTGDLAEIQQALGGNLCRCTGYRPIVDAAKQMLQDTCPDQFDTAQAQVAGQLQVLHQMDAPVLQGDGRRAYAPSTLDELFRLLTQYPRAQLVAGGTDLALQVTQFHRPIEVLISLSQLAELTGVAATQEALVIGAATPLSACEESLHRHFPSFGALFERFASLQIRNRGTLGGNIANASPIGDAPPALIALGASIDLHSAQGTREMPLEAFFVDYKQTQLAAGECIVNVRIPYAQTGDQLRCYKVSKRLEDDISAVLGCINLAVEDGVVTRVRIAFGGMAAIPKRALKCEAALLGQPWNEQSITSAQVALTKDFTPLSDFRASSAYRMRCAQNMLRRYYIELTEPQTAIQVVQYA